jgi:hypothetical protein
MAEPLQLPSFRPLSFLSNLAERVMQTESDAVPSTNGNGTEPPPVGRRSAVVSPAAPVPPLAESQPAEPETPPAEQAPATETAVVGDSVANEDPRG